MLWTNRGIALNGARWWPADSFGIVTLGNDGQFFYEMTGEKIGVASHCCLGAEGGMFTIIRMLLRDGGKFLRGAGQFIQALAIAFWVYAVDGDLEALRNELRAQKIAAHVEQPAKLTEWVTQEMWDQVQRHMETQARLSQLERQWDLLQPESQ